MRKTLRTALIWMLMLALPAQAMAALGMQLCEQVHRSGALQISGSEHGGHHDMTADSAHGAHQDAAPVASSEVPADDSLCTLCAFCVGGRGSRPSVFERFRPANRRAGRSLARPPYRRRGRHARTPPASFSRLSPLGSAALRRL